MLIPNKHSGYQAGIRIYPGGGGKGGGGGDTSAMAAALHEQNGIASKMSDFVMQAYKDNQPLVQEAAQNSREDRARQIAISDKDQARGDDMWNFYQTKGRPVVEKALDDAQNWDSQSNINQARGTAVADAQQAADSAQTQQNRLLTRMGVNPDSGKFAALNSQMQLAKATGVAQAGNSAEVQRRTQGAELRQQGANLANGTQAQSLALSGQASGTGVAANGMAGQPLGFTQSNQNQATSGMNSAGAMYGSTASGYGNLANISNQQSSDMWGGLGSLAGTVVGSAKSSAGSGIMAFMADGGPVTGPGTGTSDSVPAVNKDNGGKIQLSNGEYVISSDVVKAKGREFFDKLQDKYHRPVGNVGRAVA